MAIPTTLLPPSSTAGDLSVLTCNVKLQLLHCALKGLQAPGTTQALQTAGMGLQNNKLLPHPIDLNPVHACPCNSSSTQGTVPLPALPRRSTPFEHKGSPLAEGGCSVGTTCSQAVGGGFQGRWCTPRTDLVTQRRPREAWDK